VDELRYFYENYQYHRVVHGFHPNFIINIDETMISVGQNEKKVLVFKGEPKPVRKQAGVTEHITLLFGITAGGMHMKPLAILPLLTLPTDFPRSIYEDYDITGNKNGWITGEILNNWCQIQLVQYVYYLREYYQSNEKALVLLDNHISRDSIEIDSIWAQHNIAFLKIPAHSSHLVQPLDRCPNNEFKKFLQKNLKFKGNETANEKRIEVLKKSAISYKTALSPHYNLSGWTNAGLEPFDPERILQSGMVTKMESIPENEDKPLKKTKRVKFNSTIASLTPFPISEIKEAAQI
jgi:hypothetical protein